jgi:hypothetical protein
MLDHPLRLLALVRTCLALFILIHGSSEEMQGKKKIYLLLQP